MKPAFMMSNSYKTPPNKPFDYAAVSTGRDEFAAISDGSAKVPGDSDCSERPRQGSREACMWGSGGKSA
jgi:hypothetical protein